ncbi:pyridoxal-dependent decarboxylase [Fibrella aestuarina BUZ 2]|uniref:Pyridoxal-dependent decarboxylase n=1 Tax=Fibrella aestuarina BUZ 2 TaxID=1166018 RepID=I0K1Q9_9BACT|nr:aminotransferase class I/II-fold pyridoxal phosphate-dependent enzyme [Fibrella aestuarina]CCG98062.1 pyridoxal-dependent decarboxylase [Fibrella aestuarina BUZ 2]
MNPTLAQAYSPDAFRQMGHALIDQLADQLEATLSRQTGQAIPYHDPDTAFAHWQADSQQPLLDDPMPLFADIIARSTRLHHPRYMGHQVSPVAPAAALGGLLTEFLNNGSAVYEMGMAGNAIERIVIEHTARHIGYVPTDAATPAEQPGGIITSGGTLGNLTALLTARARLPQDVWHEGNGSQKLAIMVSAEAHYCIDRAARIMGLGEMGILKIPTDEQFKLRTDLLEATYLNARAAGLTVFAIVGSGCTTSTGSHDDLTAIGAFARQHNLWFHVDAAHGGGAFFSPTYRHLLAGSEQADSVVIDYHKMLMVPALATVVVYKRAADSHRTFQQRAQYLWDNHTTGAADWYNTGKRTFECTKFMAAVKVYTLMRLYGDELFRANVDTLYGLGHTFARLVRQRLTFDLPGEPECNLVCFRYVGAARFSDEQLNNLNQQLRTDSLNDGRFYIVQTTLRHQTYLRVSLMNPFTTETDLTELLDWLEQRADALLAQTDPLPNQP